MEKKGTESVLIDTLRIDAFSGGMNTSVAERYIEDNEASFINNMEFDDGNDLVTRNGFTISGDVYGSKISSIFSFSTDSAFIGILYSAGNQLYSRPFTLGAITNLSAGLPGGVPSNTRWYWKSLGGVAVGVYGGPNTVQVVGPAPGTVSNLAAAPAGKYIEEWRNRLFIVHTSNPNRVQCSDLGTATVWNTDGLVNPAHGITFDVAPGDGDVITGMFVFKERLFIFKRRKIYVLRAVAIPEVDPNSWELVEYSKHIGCVAATTIREVFDDVVFLSEGGLTSLSAAETTSDFNSGLVSQKIAEIQRIAKTFTDYEIFGYTLPDRSQYWLCLNTNFTETWVLDYKQLAKQGARWTRFNSPLAPTAMEAFRIGQSQIAYLFGSPFLVMGTYFANIPPPVRAFREFQSNAGVPLAVVSTINTKSFDFGFVESRKKLLRWFTTIGVESSSLHLDNFKVGYSVDESVSTVTTWDFDGMVIPNPSDKEKRITRAFRHNFQRKCVTVKFKLEHNNLDQGCSVKSFAVKYAVLSEDRAESLGIVSDSA